MTRIQRRILLGALVVWATLAVALAASAQRTPQVSGLQVPSLIRMHVRADSDQPEAQYIKELVSRELIAYLNESLATQTDMTLPAALALLEAQLPDIEMVARDAMVREGTEMSVQVQLGVFSYGPREYMGQVVPAGEYLALEVALGSGEGRNFWCILFPGMCFVPEEVEELAGERARGAVAEAAAPPPDTPERSEETTGGLRFGWRWLDRLFGRSTGDFATKASVE